MTQATLQNGLTTALDRAGVGHQLLDQWLDSTFIKIRDRGRVILAFLKTEDLMAFLQEAVDKIKIHFSNYVGLELAPDSVDPDGLIVHILTKQQLEEILKSQDGFDLWWLVNNYRANWHLGITVRSV